MNYLTLCNDLISNFEKQKLANTSTLDLLTLLWNYKIQNNQTSDTEFEIVNELLGRELRSSLWGGWGELLIIIDSMYKKEEWEYKFVVKKVKKSLRHTVNFKDFHTYDFVNGYVGNLHSLLATKNLSINDAEIITENFVLPLYCMMKKINIFDFGFAHGLSGVIYVLKEYYSINNSDIVEQTINLIKKYIYSMCDYSFCHLMLCNTKEANKMLLNQNINFSWCYGNLMLGSLIDNKQLTRMLINHKGRIKKDLLIWSENRKIITCHGLMGPFLFWKFKIIDNDYIDFIKSIGLKKIGCFFEQFPQKNVISDNELNPYSEFDGTTSTIMFLYALSEENQCVVKEYAKLFGLGN